jgi:hypothetical protein
MKFDYTLQSIKKNIAFDLDKENYTDDEVTRILKRVCRIIDMQIVENQGKISARQFEYNGIF